jgi:hypothetical protein
MLLITFIGVSCLGIEYLSILERSKSIRADRSRYGRTSYYPKHAKKDDWRIVEYISNKISMQIIQFLINRERPSSFSEIVNRVQRAPSTTSRHIKGLKGVRIISINQNRPYGYRLVNKARILQILSKYRYLIVYSRM